MVSDSELVARLHDILRSSDLDTTTPSDLRSQLEELFGVDLSDRKSFIRDQIDAFFESQHPNQPEDGAGDGEPDDDEEETDGGEKQRSNKEGKVKKRGGFNKLCSLSPKLQEFVGETELSRPEVVKKMWSYIRENNLQDPKNKRNIICDEPLRALFRVSTINMFQMNKALTKHIWPLSTEDEYLKQKERAEESDQSEVDSSKQEKQEEVEEEEGNGRKDSARRQKRKRGSAKVEKTVKKRGGGGGGFAKVCSLSPQLQTFTGETQLARTEVVKRLWSYIREKELQDPGNKQNIICDEQLRSLFNVDKINMFQMNKALTKHIWPLNSADVTENSSRREKQPKQEEEDEEEEAEEDEEEDSDEPKQEEKRPKKGGSGLLAPLPLSDALVKFFGTGENSLSRADVVKRMWEYIKKNDLQDPSDKRRVICDGKLKELFDVDSFLGFSVTKLLTAHFVKAE